MVNDLKRQASELYREQTEKKPLSASDSRLSKWMIYSAAAMVAACLAFIYIMGGFKSRQDPVIAAALPPPVVKEAPPPSLLDVSNPQPQPQTAAPAAPAGDAGATITPAPVAAKAADAAKASQVKSTQMQPAPVEKKVEAATPPAVREAPELRRSPAPGSARKPPSSAAVAPQPEPVPPVEPQVSAVEVSRRELARDVVLEKLAPMAKLYAAASKKEWAAEAGTGDNYQVSFTLPDAGTGAPVQYIWRVNIITREVAPLSYYARRLQ